jgi:hypothetical protein
VNWWKISEICLYAILILILIDCGLAEFGDITIEKLILSAILVLSLLMCVKVDRILHEIGKLEKK